jgi:hypothetical protein
MLCLCSAVVRFMLEFPLNKLVLWSVLAACLAVHVCSPHVRQHVDSLIKFALTIDLASVFSCKLFNSEGRQFYKSHVFCSITIVFFLQ